MHKTMTIILALFCTVAAAQDNETLALSALHLKGEATPDTYGIDLDDSGAYSGIQFDHTASGVTWAQVVANTNSAEFVAWLAERDADATDDAALGQEMTTALVQAINAEWSIAFNGSNEQVRQLSRRLIVESKAARVTLEDSNATIEDRLDAIAKLRRLDVISGYANQLGIGAK